MIEFNLDQLYGWIGAFIWPFFRIAAFVGTAPVVGDSAVPVYVKVALAAILSFALAPLTGDIPVIPLGSLAAIGVMVEQILIGMALGLVLRFVFGAVIMAGELIGLQMGLSFASFFDPASGGNTSVMARLLNALAILVFIAVNGHLVMLSGLGRTFEMLPIAGPRLDLNGIGVVVEFSVTLFTMSVALALPMVIALLAINLAMGILNRTAQQLSVFAVGFPITLTVSLLLLTVFLPQINDFLDRLFLDGYTAMSEVARGFGR
ncbi:flagellar biosynthetic protein FliR [Bordetella sp. 02P26C-1]|uniref:flagellar biosynthetic protein FliR n=1 Tax=Bordetella sp. 02P26C-1 TaxID=2683195 RepID=UPI0013533A99|nr:flagellar biosynthetic protein FliR [Bordetella sp. 02P26C-1]MVW78179.1 flagellar biosynthetic protein FliR [Bordetella sp. 02P26C-1]